jgi:signal transduction histidine kinase
MNFFNTFRGRLLLVLLFLLVTTLGVQYYLNLVTEKQNQRLREMQERALSSGISLGIGSLTSDYRIQDIIEQPDQTYLDENSRRRIRDILVIDNKWQVTDSLSDEYLPTQADNGTVINKNLADLTDLPPLLEKEKLGSDIEHFPNASANPSNSDSDEAHAIPIPTSQGKWYVMVLLRNDRNAALKRAAQPIIFTLGILLVSTLVTFYLVGRFTRPIANLSNAAREVAEGDLSVRVPGSERTDEMGRLAQRFNEMVSELEKKSELEAQLQQAEKSAVVGRLGSAIAHEIRNPLNYINLTLDHLRRKFTPPDGADRETFEKLTSQLKSEVGRINQQISDFLNYSRPANVDLRPVDARKVVED